MELWKWDFSHLTFFSFLFVGAPFFFSHFRLFFFFLSLKFTHIFSISFVGAPLIFTCPFNLFSFFFLFKGFSFFLVFFFQVGFSFVLSFFFSSF